GAWNVLSVSLGRTNRAAAPRRRRDPVTRWASRLRRGARRPVAGSVRSAGQRRPARAIVDERMVWSRLRDVDGSGHSHWLTAYQLQVFGTFWRCAIERAVD